MADNNTIARPYAKAAFEYALAHKELQQWSVFLQVVAQIGLDPQVAKLLKDPRVTSEQLSELFLGVSEKILFDGARNFINMLSQNCRLKVLPEVAGLFEALKAEQEKSVDVDVASFMPLNDAQKEKLVFALKERLQRDVLLHCRTDEDLLGGAVIRAGDLVIDGSVRGKLQRMRNEIIV